MEHAFKPTTHGRAILAACAALEKPLKLTRVAFGSGRVDEDTNLADMHELIRYVADGTIGERRHENDRLYLSVQYANDISHAGIATFQLSEFIVYAQNPADGTEQDFIYATMGDYTQNIPMYRPGFACGTWDFPITVIVSDEINVTVSAPAGIVTHDELMRLMNRHDQDTAAHQGIQQAVEDMRRQLSDSLQAGQLEITIPDSTGNWEPDEDTGGKWPLHMDIAAEKITEKMTPILTIHPASLEIASACGICRDARTLDGILRVYAKKAPDEPISASLALLGVTQSIAGNITGEGGDAYVLPIASRTRLGMVKLGDGLSGTPDGTVSVDQDKASDSDVEAMLDEVFPTNGQNNN